MQNSKLQFKIQNERTLKFLHFTLSSYILIFAFFIFIVPSPSRIHPESTVLRVDEALQRSLAQ